MSRIGDKAQEFTLPLYGGGSFAFQEIGGGFEGKVTLLSFVEINNGWNWFRHLVNIRNSMAVGDLQVIVVFCRYDPGSSHLITNGILENKVDTDSLITYNHLGSSNISALLDSGYTVANEYKSWFSHAKDTSFEGGAPNTMWTYIISEDFSVADKWHTACDAKNDPISLRWIKLSDLTGNVITSITENPDPQSLSDGDLDVITTDTDPDAAYVQFSSTDYSNTRRFVKARINNLIAVPTVLYTIPAYGSEIESLSEMTVVFSKPLHTGAVKDVTNYLFGGPGANDLAVSAISYEYQTVTIGNSREQKQENVGVVENVAYLDFSGSPVEGDVRFIINQNTSPPPQRIEDWNSVLLTETTVTYTVVIPKPDLYMRDNLSDDGDIPSAGGLAQSPDIFVLHTQYTQQQAQNNYGDDSGYENAVLPTSVDGSQDNYVYVRVKNRGAVDASDVNVTVYFTEPSALPTPDEWTKVNDADPTVTIAAVPTGEELICSGGVAWTNYPYTGHYCFIGAVDYPGDEAPSLDGVETLGFSDFIREHNNITWRNFNVVGNDPPPPPPDAPSGFVILPFMFHGAERKKRMQLEIVERLPVGSRSMMEVPVDILQFIKGRERTPFKADLKHKVAWMKLLTSGKKLAPEVVLPAKYKARLRLFVDIPKQYRTRKHIVYVRQLYKGKEIGRISWLLVPKEYKPWPGFKEPVVKKPVRKTGKPSGKKK